MTPASWTDSRTVLIYKSGDWANLTNWTPLSLGITVAILYANVVANRLEICARDSSTVLSVEKGLMEHKDSFDHNFVNQSALDGSVTENKEIDMVLLDLANEFGSVPHQYI